MIVALAQSALLVVLCIAGMIFSKGFWGWWWLMIATFVVIVFALILNGGH